MDKRPLKIMGLKALLCLREFEATFGDIGFAEGNSELRSTLRVDFIPGIDRANKETCLTIATLYSQMGNKKMEQKYYSLAKQYAHMGIIA